MRDIVEAFSQEMENKLKQYDESKGESGWLDTGTFRQHAKRMQKTLDKLGKAIDQNDMQAIIRESVDAANYSMMLWDLANLTVYEDKEPFSS